MGKPANKKTPRLNQVSLIDFFYWSLDCSDVQSLNQEEARLRTPIQQRKQECWFGERVL